MSVANIAVLRLGWFWPVIGRSRQILAGNGRGGFFQWYQVAACKERNHRVSDEKSCGPPLGEAAPRAPSGRGFCCIENGAKLRPDMVRSRRISAGDIRRQLVSGREG